MVNHPNRRRSPYTAESGGESWAQGPKAEEIEVTRAMLAAGVHALACILRGEREMPPFSEIVVEVYRAMALQARS